MPAFLNLISHQSYTPARGVVNHGKFMNATLIEGGKVHGLMDRVARCGVGKNRERGEWQMELGEVTCRRCVKLQRSDAHKQAQETQKNSTRDGHG